MHLNALSISYTYKLPIPSGFGRIILVATILGILYGTCLGLADYYLDKKLFRKQTLGKIILFKTIISLSVLTFLVTFIGYVFSNLFISSFFYIPDLTSNNKSAKYLFSILVICYFFMTLVINFINQVNKKFGPGILIPLLLGKYKNLFEEERIFMFMDLRSSTSLAEKLGHLKYSSFIRDGFMDINQMRSAFNAEVYQYAGDEIVVTWRVNDGLKNLSCIKFFFACEKQFVDRAKYYTKHYDYIPEFKAGIHMGKVTAVEIGEIKRDIAYHGDTLNTTARIQSVCNQYNKKFLISESLLAKIDSNQGLKIESLGMIQLRGKTTSVGIASVELIQSSLQT